MPTEQWDWLRQDTDKLECQGSEPVRLDGFYCTRRRGTRWEVQGVCRESGEGKALRDRVGSKAQGGAAATLVGLQGIVKNICSGTCSFSAQWMWPYVGGLEMMACSTNERKNIETKNRKVKWYE